MRGLNVEVKVTRHHFNAVTLALVYLQKANDVVAAVSITVCGKEISRLLLSGGAKHRYPPTHLAHRTLFGTGADESEPRVQRGMLRCAGQDARTQGHVER